MFAISLGALAANGSAGQLSRAAGPPLMPSRQVDSVSAAYEAQRRSRDHGQGLLYFLINR
jgi:hypothetical protein